MIRSLKQNAYYINKRIFIIVLEYYSIFEIQFDFVYHWFYGRRGVCFINKLKKIHKENKAVTKIVIVIGKYRWALFKMYMYVFSQD